MNPRLRNSAAHVFVTSLKEPSLTPEDEHHLDRVLRIEARDAITVSDGLGSWAVANWSRVRGVELLSEVFAEQSRPRLVIGCAIPKGDKPELIVQKLSELGIDSIIFFETARSIVHWDEERRRKQLERLRRIALEASMQSRRVYLPRVDCGTYDRVIEMNNVAIAEPGGHDRLDGVSTTLLIGPEGGFDAEELDYAVPKIGLSRNVLRVETAAIVGASRLVESHSS